MEPAGFLERLKPSRVKEHLKIGLLAPVALAWGIVYAVLFWVFLLSLIPTLILALVNVVFQIIGRADAWLSHTAFLAPWWLTVAAELAGVGMCIAIVSGLLLVIWDKLIP